MYLKETNLLNKKEIDNLWNRYLKMILEYPVKNMALCGFRSLDEANAVVSKIIEYYL